MRVLGIDPGTHRMGYGVIDVAGSRMAAVAYGCLEPKPGDSVLPGDLLVRIHQDLTKLIADYSPDVLAVEELFFAKNVTTGLRVAEARGVAIMTARAAKILVAEYKPNMIKSVVAGYGLASKQQMQKMVKMLLGLETVPKPDDAADGLAVAITHGVLGKSFQIRNN